MHQPYGGWSKPGTANTTLHGYCIHGRPSEKRPYDVTAANTLPAPVDGRLYRRRLFMRAGTTPKYWSCLAPPAARPRNRPPTPTRGMAERAWKAALFMRSGERVRFCSLASRLELEGDQLACVASPASAAPEAAWTKLADPLAAGAVRLLPTPARTIASTHSGLA